MDRAISKVLGTGKYCNFTILKKKLKKKNLFLSPSKLIKMQIFLCARAQDEC